jgi:membrane associated rhomboid family serine protease
MIPLRDNIPSRTVPVMNYLMIAACAVVFFLQLGDEQDGRADLVEGFGMVPKRISSPGEPVIIQEPKLARVRDQVGYVIVERDLGPAAISPWLTMLTCIFLHGGWMHFLGNMWFLYIFGDNVEDRFGHLGYAIFYLASGVAASVAHFATDPGSSVPTIGASGAIAGVMGAYLLLYPRATVLSLVPILYVLRIIVLPAPIFLGIWFVMQLLQGMSPGATGVAWWAHIGGFVVGAIVAALLSQAHALRPPVAERLPNTDHITSYRYRR